MHKKPILEVQNLSQSFNFKTIFHNVNFTLYENEIIWLLGKNGVGKTTLFKSVVALYEIDGNIYYKDKLLKDCFRQYQSETFFLSSSIHFYSQLSLEKNLKFFFNLYQCQPTLEKYEAILLQFELFKFQSYLLKHFSSGMLKKASLALMMFLQPKILFLDEPFNNLDLETVNKCFHYLDQLRQQGSTILFTSHQFYQFPLMLDRVFILKDKQLIIPSMPSKSTMQEADKLYAQENL